MRSPISSVRTCIRSPSDDIDGTSACDAPTFSLVDFLVWKWHAPLTDRSLRRLFEQFPTDQHAADFGCAGADFVELGVAQQPPGRVVVDVAVAAEKLDGVERALRGF